MLFGEGVLTPTNAFVYHSTDFQEIVSPQSLYHSPGHNWLVRKAERKFCESLGKQQSDGRPDPAHGRDIADLKELDRHERERESSETRAQKLSEENRRRAERKNEVRRRGYLARRRP